MKELYLVTGATGHLGNTVAHRLARAGRQVRALVLPGEEHAPQLPGGVEAVAGDVRSPASLEALFAGAEGRDVTVIHCAGIVSIASRFDQNVYDVNVTGTKNVVDACVRRGVKKLVHVSSVHALPEKPGGAPVSETDVFSPGAVVGLYAKTKAAATAYALAARARGLDVRVVHPSGICGPYDYGHGHLTQLVQDFCTGRLAAGVDGGYDFVDVRDVAAGILACCERGRPGECYILSGRYCTVRDVLAMLHRITGRRRVRVMLPLWLARAAAPLSEQYYRLLRQPPAVHGVFAVHAFVGRALFPCEGRAGAGLYHAPLRHDAGRHRGVAAAAGAHLRGAAVKFFSCREKPEKGRRATPQGG
ncbi:SDR family NAD(P)-dependent oxidoreductase [Ruthenibacterium lactatiformans]|uniref:SDR family NAD(P)-dependent oxidoreductase n=1 Tax=Ruthenibacterium lactatiformans TaxID=1550024 RepID=UPI002494A899|nr:SDR family NAD(P)-dependent oxidoreductase [Ruthenibacterium lactatiformans]